MQFDRKTKIMGVVGLVAIIAVGAIGAKQMDRDDEVRAKLEKEVPRTSFSSVECGKPFGSMCEAVAGKNVVYTTPDGRYLFLGDVIDLKKKLDITQQRQQEVATVNSATGAILGSGRIEDAAATGQPPSVQSIPQGAPGPKHGGVVKVTLPATNGIVHNAGAPIQVSVFSDYRCGFCKAMFAELASHPEIQVTEYPIAILGEDSATKAREVFCAQDRLAAAAIAFSGGTPAHQPDCRKTDGIIDSNSKFASANGIASTPVLVRADGQTQFGFAGVDQLKRWLGGAGA